MHPQSIQTIQSSSLAQDQMQQTACTTCQFIFAGLDHAVRYTDAGGVGIARQKARWFKYRPCPLAPRCASALSGSRLKDKAAVIQKTQQYAQTREYVRIMLPLMLRDTIMRDSIMREYRRSRVPLLNPSVDTCDCMVQNVWCMRVAVCRCACTSCSVSCVVCYGADYAEKRHLSCAYT